MTEQQIYVVAVKLVKEMDAEIANMDLDERLALAGDMSQVTPASGTYAALCKLFERLFEDFDEDEFLAETRK
jgi:hypothetical protein